MENQTEVIVKRSESTEEGPAAMKGARDAEAEGGFEPERDFRYVWSADAQAHSSTLQIGDWGRGVNKITDEI